MLANLLALAGLTLAALLAVVGYRRQQEQEQYLASPRKKKATWKWGVLLFASMVAGILARYYWELFAHDHSITETRSLDLLRPLLISPLVFFPIWAYSSRTPKELTSVLVAFQNGFFWQAVFETAGPIK